MDKRLLMMATHMDDDRKRYTGRYDDAEDRYPHGEERVYNGGYMEPYGRFSDRRGRKHYDNGRYAPMSVYEPMSYDPMDMAPMREERPSMGDGGWVVKPINKIGFRDDVRTAYPSDIRSAVPEYNVASTPKMSGHAESNVSVMNYATADEWLRTMKNEDGTVGPHWSFDQVKTVMEQKDIDCDPVEFWVTMNMMYSDYSKVAKQMSVNSVDFYVKLAKAFLEDKDAGPDKLANYYRYVVK